ncbi:MAG: GAF domain-containing protein [Anaerolineaceae bacterium]|nr:GAF domain-containing protein [Anaerolineaceae bacterium]
MVALLNWVIWGSLVIHSTLLVYAFIRRKWLRTRFLWLGLTILFSAAAASTFLLSESVLLAGRSGRGFALVLTLAALLTSLGALVLLDVKRSGERSLLRSWLLLGLVGIVILSVVSFMGDGARVGQSDWLAEMVASPSPISLATLAGLGIVTLFLLGITFRSFYLATLPESANRSLFWVMDIALVVISIIMIISGAETLVLSGIIALTLGVVGSVYVQVSYRVFDIRSSLNLFLQTLILIALVALLLYGSLALLDNIPIEPGIQKGILITLLAIGITLIYLPLRGLSMALTAPLLRASGMNPTLATRRYSQQVSKAVELDELIHVGTETLNEVMGVRRSGLLLVNDIVHGNGSIELLVIPGGGFVDMKDVRGRIAKASPIYRKLAEEQSPIPQFDLEFSPEYRDLSENERQFFKSLGMSAYAPVVVENTVIGILACGPKVSDAPFYARDLELLSTMANQTGVALRNARLVADLRHLNRSMQSLNTGLEAANQRLDELDQVKTDFVTIASHELRTPLAQMRGYTDILDALNEGGMLDQDQIGGMVNNLRKATERMEELIAAMLDVSQLDVNAMDLRFAQTTPEAVVRMAIEPLTDVIKQRKLTLSARGLRGLPPIEADMQRLVQSIRNVVVNAIKFTPDGGRIEINAGLRPPDEYSPDESILITISDSGVGVNRDDLELIFEKFYRGHDPSLHSTGAYKFMGAGPGLGLTIARGMIEGHGGRIWAESTGHDMEKCPGSTFYIQLPLHPPAKARRVLPFEPQAAEGGNA